MKRILVIDQATIKTSYNIIEIVNGKPKWVCCSVIKIKTTNDVIHRINELYDKLSDIIDEYDIDTLVLEEVPVSRKTNLNVSIVLLKLLGIMELLACRKKIKVEIMNIAYWKNTCGIKCRTRAEQKKESIQLALKRFPAYKSIIIDSDDCSDALNMGYAFLKNKKII